MTTINNNNIKGYVNSYINNKEGLPSDLQKPINDWDVSNVTNMKGMFSGYLEFNESLEDWNVSNVTNMNEMFYDCAKFNQSLAKWNVSKVESMSSMFENCANFNQPLDSWGDKVSNVEDMNYMFYGCANFNQPLENWNVSKVKNMSSMFQNCAKFNQPLNGWGQKVSNVTSMYKMFQGCVEFNQPLENWNVSKVESMDNMFNGCANFNQPLEIWNVSNVESMDNMFNGCANFNQPLNNWNVSNVKTMENMFDGCEKFNQPLDKWGDKVSLNNTSNSKTIENSPQMQNSTVNPAVSKIEYLENLRSGKITTGPTDPTDPTGRKQVFVQLKNRVTAKILQSICSDASVCIAFGSDENKIDSFFDNFDNFNLLSGPIKGIGEASANGFVKELTFKKEGYVANAVLKSSVKKDADNLLYEGLVGMFLNEVAVKKIPTFLKTYGVYSYASTDFYNKMYSPEKYLNEKYLNEKYLTNDKLKKLDLTSTIDFKYACDNSRYLAVLIQYLKEAKTLNQMYTNENFRDDEVTGVLYQVYYALSTLSKVFTHYDLHDDNVLLYMPVKDSYIEYHYHTQNGEVSFKSCYLAKIIDYGRSYFYKDANNSSQSVLDKVNAACNYNKSFGWLFSDPKKDNYWISSKTGNMSHDLRLLDILKGNGDDVSEEMQKILDDVVYRTDYGTPEIIVGKNANKIYNVNDAYLRLEEIIKSQDFKDKNDQVFSGKNKLGDLHVYTSGEDMTYIPYEVKKEQPPSVTPSSQVPIASPSEAPPQEGGLNKLSKRKTVKKNKKRKTIKKKNNKRKTVKKKNSKRIKKNK